MYKCCRLCRFCYCRDESDVSGFICEKFISFKITELDIIHPFCWNGFKLSLLKLIYGWLLYG
jgi:hypothetical protein